MKYVFFFLGGYGNLPQAELKSLLSILSVATEPLFIGKRLAIVNLEETEVQELIRRVALTKIVGKMFYFGKLSDLRVDSICIDVPYGYGRSFRVDVVKLSPSKSFSTLELQAFLGEIVASKGYVVDLKNPDFVVLGFVWKDMVIMAVKLGEPGKLKNFLSRWPGRRPSFHPSTLDPRLARALVNLSGCRYRTIVDPFCGVGGICIEAGLIGYHTICIDIDFKMLRGAKKNLCYYGIRSFDLICGDSSKPPLREAKCIVTDPPYGRSSSLHRKSHLELLKSLIVNFGSASSIVLISPKGSGAEEIFASRGLNIEGRYELKVHRSLTRVIYKLGRSIC